MSLPLPVAVCKNCNSQTTANYCSNCGQKNDVAHLNWKTLFSELTNLLFNADRSLLVTFKNMLIYPGPSIVGYLKGGRKRYLPPFHYFACSLTIYWVIAKLFFAPWKAEIGDGMTMDIKDLLILLFGMAFIGWIICGVKWGATRQRSYNFIESVVVFAYIYGTNFVLAPYVVAFEIPIWGKLKAFFGTNMKLVTDLPLILLIAYMAYQFCKTARISKLKYYLTLLFGFLYYYSMLDLISNFLTFIRNYLW